MKQSSPHQTSFFSSDFITILKELESPLSNNVTQITSLSNEERDLDDRMETFCVEGSFDIVSQRNFVCLCTRCREMKNNLK